MIPLIYYDTSILQNLIDNPVAWNHHYDWSKEFGSSVEPIQSYFLLCEYFGFEKSKLETPEFLLKPDWRIFSFPTIKDSEEKANLKISCLTVTLGNLHVEIEKHIYNAILLKQDFFNELFKKRKTRRVINQNKWRTLCTNSNLFEDGNHLENLLFQRLIFQYESNFEIFAKNLAALLAWDTLCSIEPQLANKEQESFIQRMLLGFWRGQYLDHGQIFPFARTAIRLTPIKSNSPRNYLMKNYKDAADSEMYTKLIFGQQTENGLRPVNVITLEAVEVVKARIKTVKDTVFYIEDSLRIYLPRFSGKIYCVDESLRLIKSLDPEVIIKLPDLSKN